MCLYNLFKLPLIVYKNYLYSNKYYISAFNVDVDIFMKLKFKNKNESQKNVKSFNLLYCDFINKVFTVRIRSFSLISTLLIITFIFE